MISIDTTKSKLSNLETLSNQIKTNQVSINLKK